MTKRNNGQSDLFGDADDEPDSTYPPELYGGLPPHYPTETSREAAESVSESVQNVRARVFELIVAHGGLTADEVAVTMGTLHNTTSPRIRELYLLGRVVDSGERRLTRSGRRAIVWRAAALAAEKV